MIIRKYSIVAATIFLSTLKTQASSDPLGLDLSPEDNKVSYSQYIKSFPIGKTFAEGDFRLVSTPLAINWRKEAGQHILNSRILACIAQKDENTRNCQSLGIPSYYGLTVHNSSEEDIGYMVFRAAEDSLFINRFIIHPEHRGKGYLSPIFKTLENFVKEQQQNLPRTFGIYTETSSKLSLIAFKEGYRQADIQGNFLKQPYPIGRYAPLYAIRFIKKLVK